MYNFKHNMVNIKQGTQCKQTHSCAEIDSLSNSSPYHHDIWTHQPGRMYIQYANTWPDSNLAHEFLVGCSGGHFSTSLYENRLNDAWIHADSKNKERMSYLGFRDYSAETGV